jgi:predicted HAD superfamily Cof-like phosphohydrolase
MTSVMWPRRGITLHDEEHREVREALDNVVAVDASRPGVRRLLEEVAEELADDLVIAYGTADLLGIDLDEAFRLKMDGNMAKLPECGACNGHGTLLLSAGDPTHGIDPEHEACDACNGTGKDKPIKRFDGKIEKPEGWQKPSFAEAIR